MKSKSAGESPLDEYNRLATAPAKFSVRSDSPRKSSSSAPGRLAWKAYLGDLYGTEDIPPYAAAARAVDLVGLPPAYIAVGDLDLFLDEDIEYAQRLLAAEVPVELHVYPGGVHGFNSATPQSPLALRFREDRNAALLRLLHPASGATNTTSGVDRERQ